MIGQLIHDLKYHSVRALAHPLAEILNTTLPPTKTPSIIVPLPTIGHHIRERGFDHTQLIAKSFTKLRSNCTLQNLLTRNHNTVQVGSNRSTRLAQASSAYTLTQNVIIHPNLTYILFDDVWTTGASMQSAYSLLKNAGAQHIIIAILALSQ
ncbi:MAG: phosphoribosyltransferase family protein [Candidatus Saccharibacteria bacterium]|nr:phosphoribosyltransferase family protein [Candidatus Saccharibacteria bacterium]